MEDDARAVAKMLKNNITALTKEREERKNLEKETDGATGMLKCNNNYLGKSYAESGIIIIQSVSLRCLFLKH